MGGIILPEFKVNCKTIEIKTVWFGYKNRHIDQQGFVSRAQKEPSKSMVRKPTTPFKNGQNISTHIH